MSGGGVALAGVPPPAAQGAASQSHWALGPPQRTQRESFLTPNETCSSPSRGLHHAPDADPVSEGLTLLSTHPTLLLQPGTPSAKQVTHFPPSAPSPHLPTCGEGGDLASQRCQDGRKCRGKAGSDTTPRSLPAALPGPGRHSASTPPVQHLVSRLPDSALASSLPLRPPPPPLPVLQHPAQGLALHNGFLSSALPSSASSQPFQWHRCDKEGDRSSERCE